MTANNENELIRDVRRLVDTVQEQIQDQRTCANNHRLEVEELTGRVAALEMHGISEIALRRLKDLETKINELKADFQRHTVTEDADRREIIRRLEEISVNYNLLAMSVQKLTQNEIDQNKDIYNIKASISQHVQDVVMPSIMVAGKASATRWTVVVGSIVTLLGSVFQYIIAQNAAPHSASPAPTAEVQHSK